MIKKDIFIEGYGTARLDEKKYQSIPMVPLETYCDIITGSIVKKAARGENVYVINGKALEDGSILTEAVEEINVEKKGALSRSKILPGDLLMLSRGASPKFAIADGFFAEKTVYATTNLFILRPKKDMDPAYLMAYLTSPFGELALSKIQKGTTIPMFTIRAIKKLPVPQADKDLQREICEQFIQAKAEYEETIRKAKQTFNKIKVKIYKQLGLMDALESTSEKGDLSLSSTNCRLASIVRINRPRMTGGKERTGKLFSVKPFFPVICVNVERTKG